jgi:hypothetical protein
VQAQQKLATACGAVSAEQLAANHACALLLCMLQRSPSWTASHADISSFIAILGMCPGETLVAVGEPLCTCLSQITRDPDRDPALRMTILRSMHNLLEDDKRAPPLCAKFGIQVIVLVLIPPLIWRAGVRCHLSHCSFDAELINAQMQFVHGSLRVQLSFPGCLL